MIRQCDGAEIGGRKMKKLEGSGRGGNERGREDEALRGAQKDEAVREVR